jgi:ABC-type branched-subunit amino acid transport system substrate-binding protein
VKARRPYRQSFRVVAAGATLAGALLIGATAGASATSKGNLVVGVLSTYTGANAGYGQEGMAGCIPAMAVINAAGGVMGHDVTCEEFNSNSDPADAVPEVHHMLALNDLLLTLGSGGTTAPAIVRLVNAAKLTVFSETGQSLFNVNHYPYFWRDVPVDASQGYAMAIATVESGYTHAAAVFGQGVSSQGSRPSFVKGMKLLGHPVVKTVVVPSSAPSYATQVAGIQGANADAVVGEVTPASSATFFSELKQVYGKLPPLVGDEAYDEGPWLKAVGGAVGSTTLSKRLTLVLPLTTTGGPGFDQWKAKLLASSDPTKKTYVTDSYSAADFDAIVLTALAADEAHSLKSASYNHLIYTVANGVPGAVVVHTYAQAVAALGKGKKIHYVGASGPITFDKYHNWEPGYAVDRLTGKSVKRLRVIPTSVLNKLITGHHASV